MTSATSERLEQLGVTGPGLPLTPSPEIATSGNAEAQDNHGQNRRDARGDACPVQVDERDAVDRLVNGSFVMTGLRGTVDGEVRVVANNGGVGETVGAGDGRRDPVLLNMGADEFFSVNPVNGFLAHAE